MGRVNYLKTKDTTFLEVSWERQMQFAGLERWERNQYKKNGDKVETSTTDVGQKFLRRFHSTVSEAIEEAQAGLIGSGSRRHINARAACILIPAETCAMLVIRILLDALGNAPDHNFGVNYQSTCKRVAKAIETELNYRHWLKESRGAAREYAKVNGLAKVPVSQADRLIKEAGMHKSNLSRWRRRFKELEEYAWTKTEKDFVGDFFLQTTINALSDTFETFNAFSRGLERKQIRMTESFQTEFRKVGEQLSKSQVIKKPMLTRPQAWEQV